jgi:hypothetical protein
MKFQERQDKRPSQQKLVFTEYASNRIAIEKAVNKIQENISKVNPSS